MNYIAVNLIYLSNMETALDIEQCDLIRSGGHFRQNSISNGQIFNAFVRKLSSCKRSNY